MKCRYHLSMPDACQSKATLFVGAFGVKKWWGLYCRKHAPKIIARRSAWITKYEQNVVVRPISDYDKKRTKELRKGK